MLRILGQQTIVDPARSLLGTPQFSVYMAPTCSGMEGIGLIAVFLTAYLWLFRRELRFPQSFMLIPAGIAIVWLLNSVRITTLILLGGSLEQVALEGFHSVAGWIFFNTTALGLVIASRRTGLFARAKGPADLPLSANPAAPYLVPLMVTIATAMITGAFFRDFDFAYPLRVIFTAAALWLYHGRFRDLLWCWSWPAAALGALAFLLWILLGWHGSSAVSNTIRQRLAPIYSACRLPMERLPDRRSGDNGSAGGRIGLPRLPYAKTDFVRLRVSPVHPGHVARTGGFVNSVRAFASKLDCRNHCGDDLRGCRLSPRPSL